MIIVESHCLYIKGMQQQVELLVKQELGQHVSDSYIVDMATKYDQNCPHHHP
jgi:hypothetical protein